MKTQFTEAETEEPGFASSTILQEKPAKLLVGIKEINNTLNEETAYASTLQHKAETQYSHTIKTLQQLEDEGLIRKRKNGRRKEVMLTKDGEEIVENLQNIIEVQEA